MKKKYTKKKARGFSKITGKTRISRAQIKQLSHAYDDIIKKLSSSDREKLNQKRLLRIKVLNIIKHYKKYLHHY
jgi:hypothetical protein